jgi:hypothetical protein
MQIKSLAIDPKFKFRWEPCVQSVKLRCKATWVQCRDRPDTASGERHRTAISFLILPCPHAWDLKAIASYVTKVSF